VYLLLLRGGATQRFLKFDVSRRVLAIFLHHFVAPSST